MKILQFLIFVALSINCYAQKIQNPELLNAVKSEDIVRIKELLDKGADANTKDRDNTNALIWASRYGNFDIVKLLVKSGADVNAIDDSYSTALNNSIYKGNLEIVKFLIENGAEVNPKPDKSKNPYISKFKSPLETAIEQNQLAILKYLLEKGAVKKMFMPCNSRMSIEMVNFLIANGADLNTICNSSPRKEPALMFYIEKGKFEIAQLLIESGANVNAKNRSSETLLDISLRDLPNPLILIGKNEKIDRAIENAQNEKIRTEYFKIIKSLIKKGIDVNGSTALIKAIEYTIIEKTINANLTNSQTLYFVDSIRTEIVKLLISNGANVNIQVRSDETALMESVKKNNKEIAKLLLDKGANVDVKKWKGETALMLAVNNCNTDIVKLLVENKADVNVIDDYGQTALSRAQNCNGIIEILKNAGAR